MRGVLPTAVVFVAATTLGVAGWAASRGPDAPELGNLLDDVVAAGAPGVLLVVREDGEARSEVRGLADRTRSIPMRDDDRFRIGSLTKTFVATLVLRLVEDGRLRLDDSVEQWLPGLIPGGREITVRHLLEHTAGLFDYVADDRLSGTASGTGRQGSSSRSRSHIRLSDRRPGAASRTRARTT